MVNNVSLPLPFHKVPFASTLTILLQVKGFLWLLAIVTLASSAKLLRSSLYSFDQLVNRREGKSDKLLTAKKRDKSIKYDLKRCNSWFSLQK